jgi:hypothetical protein
MPSVFLALLMLVLGFSLPPIHNLVFNCSQGSDGFGISKGFGRGIGGRAGFEWKTPPQGYVCHRCKEPGMFIF